jgi:MscS family membrane protein
MDFLNNGLPAWFSTGWISTLLSLLLTAILIIGISAIVDRLMQKLLDRFEKTPGPWDDAFVHAVRLPARALVWIVGITMMIDTIDRDLKLSLFDFTYYARKFGLVIVIAWSFLRFISVIEEYYSKHHSSGRDQSLVDNTTISALVKLLRMAVYICASLLILQTMGFSISGVLAFAGASGLGLSFAAKDLLANFFGAIMIYLDRPFKVGDWIRSPDKEIEGTVESIGWRLTQIRTFDKRPLYVPNSIFTTISVENPSRMSHRRFYETIRIRYMDIDYVTNIVTGIKEMLSKHPAIDSKQTLFVNLNQYAESNLQLMVYAFSHDTDWVRFQMLKQDLLLRIYEIIKNNGAEIALPTSTVRFSNSNEFLEDEESPAATPNTGSEMAFGRAWVNTNRADDDED